MKELSTQTIILPILVVLAAVIVVSLVSVYSVKNVRNECDSAFQELSICQSSLSQKQERLHETLRDLNVTEQDLSKYDAIYENTSQEAELLAQELEVEKAKEDNVIVYNVPHRAVPTSEAFGKASRIELMLERIDRIENNINSDDDDLRIVVGGLYLNALDFRNLFLVNGVKIKLNEDMQQAYMENQNHIKELEQFYNFFDEHNRKKMRTRVTHLAKLQRTTFKVMQSYYFIR